MTGIYSIAESIQRTVPTSTNEITHETIHPSVLNQKSLAPEVTQAIGAHPSIVCGLSELEQIVKDNWHVARHSRDITVKDEGHKDGVMHAIGDMKSFADKIGHELLHKIDTHHPSASTEQNLSGQTTITSLLEEHSMGSVFKHVLHTQK